MEKQQTLLLDDNSFPGRPEGAQVLAPDDDPTLADPVEQETFPAIKPPLQGDLF